MLQLKILICMKICNVYALVFMDGYLQKYKIEDEIKDMNVLSLKDKEKKWNNI